MQFRLEKKEATRGLLKFNILNSGGGLCGTVSVLPSQEAALLASWKGATTPPAKKTDSRAALVAALKRGPRLSKEALLRGSWTMAMTSGLSAMIRCAAALELDRENAGATMETLSIGHAEGSYDYVLEIAGAHLCYSVSMYGEEVRTGASLVDSISQPQTLLRTPDAESGWELVFRFISALEKYGVRSLVRPILVGEPGQPDAWVIA